MATFVARPNGENTRFSRPGAKAYRKEKKRKEKKRKKKREYHLVKFYHSM
jgi:hypothetical protein